MYTGTIRTSVCILALCEIARLKVDATKDNPDVPAPAPPQAVITAADSSRPADDDKNRINAGGIKS